MLFAEKSCQRRAIFESNNTIHFSTINATLNKRNTAMPTPHFFSLPREIRDEIYTLHYRSQSVSGRTIRPQRLLTPLSTDDPIIFFINQFSQQICLTNKVVAAEYMERVLEKEDIRLFGIVPQLMYFLRSLKSTNLLRAKSVEIDFRSIPLRAWNNPRATEATEIIPLYKEVVWATSIKALTIPLLFSGVIRNMPWKFGYEPGHAAPRYSIVIAAHAIGLLVNGHLKQVTLAIRAKDAWAMIEPLVDIQKLANAHWSTWDMASVKPLVDLENEYNSNANDSIALFDFIVATEMRPEPELELGEVLYVALKRPV
jgi:hypothetical protein